MPGSDLLGKVVQVPMELPLPDRASLQQMFVDLLSPVLTAERDAHLLDEEYWGEVCVNGLDHFLATPRDAIRLANAVTATLPAVHGEVNPVDFVALETLRLFSPIAYESIRQRRDAFLLPPEARRAETGMLKITQEFHERWRERIDPRRPRGGRLPGHAAVPARDRRAGDAPDRRGRRGAVARQPAGVHGRAVPGLLPALDPGRRDLQRRPAVAARAPGRPGAVRRHPAGAGPRLAARRAGPAARLPGAAGDPHRRQRQRRGGRVGAARDLPGGRRPAAPRGPGGERAARSTPRPRSAGSSGGSSCRSSRASGSICWRCTFAAGASLATIVDTVVMLGQEHGKYGGEWREGSPTVVTLSQLAQLENLGLAFVRDAAAEDRLLRVPRDARRAAVLVDLEPRRVPDMGRPDDRDRRRAARVPRAVHARGRVSQRQRARPAGRQPARPAPAAPVPGAGLDRRPGRRSCPSAPTSTTSSRR